MKIIKIILFFYTLILGISLVTVDNMSALSVDNPCKNVETIFARGSGAKLNDTSGESLKFFTELKNRISNTISYNSYELGTDTYNDFKYPAVAVNNWNWLNSLGASLSSGQYFAYGNSVKQGVGELQSYLSKRYNKCKSSDSWYIIGGYSQGAQVIGQALNGLDKNIRDRIVFVGLFGDPKLYYPEGLGINPPACRGENISPWRRAASNCKLDNGSLSSRIPYLPSDMESKTGLWCYKKDMICDIAAAPHNEGHGEYKKDRMAIDEAAREAVEKLAKVLPKEQSKAIDVTRKRGSNTAGIDTVFIIDTTGSMGNRLAQASQFARNSADKIKSNNGRVALVEFKDLHDSIAARILSTFEDDYSKFTLALDGLYADGGGDTPEAGLHALMTAFNGLNWKDGATKAAVLLTDAPFHSPDLVDGATVESVAKRSLEIDPVNVYPVVPEYVSSDYTELAEATSGQVIIDNDNTEAALNVALTKIQERPVVLLKNTEYFAETQQPITFDASDSYVIDSEITKYDWDFDGDGAFETTTTTPVSTHSYEHDFTGTMQVRASASNGTQANMSASVTIQPITPPALPSTPKNLHYEIVSTHGTKSTIKLRWVPTDTSRVVIRLNDMPIGTVENTRHSIEITDIDRTEDVTVGVASISEQKTIGEYNRIIIPKQDTTPSSEPPILSTCSQSNIFIRLTCTIIAYAKKIIGGITYYLIPYLI